MSFIERKCYSFVYVVHFLRSYDFGVTNRSTIGAHQLLVYADDVKILGEN
jgi:hypothetical protein